MEFLFESHLGPYILVMSLLNKTVARKESEWTLRISTEHFLMNEMYGTILRNTLTKCLLSECTVAKK